jgi:hypothetical protein
MEAQATQPAPAEVGLRSQVAAEEGAAGPVHLVEVGAAQRRTLGKQVRGGRHPEQRQVGAAVHEPDVGEVGSGERRPAEPAAGDDDAAQLGLVQHGAGKVAPVDVHVLGTQAGEAPPAQLGSLPPAPGESEVGDVLRHVNTGAGDYPVEVVAGPHDTRCEREVFRQVGRVRLELPRPGAPRHG